MKSASKLWDGCKVDQIKGYVLGDLCFKVKEKSLPSTKKCHHRGIARMNCKVVHDLINFATILLQFLSEGPLKDFLPNFELVGSMAEGTRICMANELDIGVSFQFLKERANVPFKVQGDPFSLKKAITAPVLMDRFFNRGVFLFHDFLKFFLEAIEEAVCQVFAEGRNPTRLRCITTNQQWREGETPCGGRCRNGSNFEQCTECIVAVSQTKSGIALQFVWQSEKFGSEALYCSLDLIPMFPIEAIQVTVLTRLINTPMLGKDPPRGWLRFLYKYVVEYMMIKELAQAGEEAISVGLKSMNFERERNHHIKPVQAFTKEKFSSERMRQMYCYIKFLKNVANIKINSFWLKKEISKEKYEEILISCNDDDRALVLILSQPEIKTKVQGAIDIKKSNYLGFVNLKNQTVQDVMENLESQVPSVDEDPGAEDADPLLSLNSIDLA